MSRLADRLSELGVARENCLMREQSPPSPWSRLYSPRHPDPSQTTSLSDFRITARAQMFLVAALARWTVAKARPWLSVSVT